MRLLQTYQDLRLADANRQLLARENIPTTLVTSDGYTIDKWSDYITNFEADIGGSLYVEDAIFEKASRIYQKIERKRNRSKFFDLGLLLFVSIMMWVGNIEMTAGVKKQLASFNLPIKYAGAIVYGLFLVFETKDFIKKWWQPSDMYRKTEIGKSELQQDTRSILTKLFITTTLFVIAYFL